MSINDDNNDEGEGDEGFVCFADTCLLLVRESGNAGRDDTLSLFR